MHSSASNLDMCRCTSLGLCVTLYGVVVRVSVSQEVAAGPLTCLRMLCVRCAGYVACGMWRVCAGCGILSMLCLDRFIDSLID